MALPCTQRRPASTMSKFDESIMNGTRAMSGSVAAMFRKRVIAAVPSRRPASKLMSITVAPASICCFATPRAAR